MHYIIPIIVTLVAILVVAAVLALTMHQPESFDNSSTRNLMTTNKQGTHFYQTTALPSNPPARPADMDLMSTLHKPINNYRGGMSGIPAEGFEQPCTENCPTEISQTGQAAPATPATPATPSPMAIQTGPIATTAIPQSIVVDRLIFANRNSQLRAMGDPIRGDLPIVPNPPGWFTPSVTPQIDLQRGALNHLAGANPVTDRLDSLFALSQQGLLPASRIPLTTVSGTAYAQLGNRGRDLTVVTSL